MSFFSGIVKVADAVKNGVELAAVDAEKAAAWLIGNKTLLTGLAGLAGPLASQITGNAMTLYEQIAASVEAAGEAAGANGLSVTLDASVIAAIKADIAAAKGFKI